MQMPSMFRDFAPDERRNAALNAAGEALWGFQAAMVASATVLTVLLTDFGASARLIGVIPAIEGTLIVVPQLAGIWLFHSQANRRRNLVVWHLAFPIPVLLAMGALLLSPAREYAPFMRCALPVMFAAFIAGIGVIVAVWMDWLADLFRPSIRGTAIGIAFATAALAGVAGGALAGAAIGLWPVITTYGILYLAAGAIAAASFACFWFIKDPPRGPAPTAVSRPPSTAETLLRFRASLADTNFRSYLIGRGIAAAGFGITPFIAIYYRSEAGGALSGGGVVAAGSLMALGSAAGNMAFGKIGDRLGHRIGVITGAATQALTLLLMLTTGGPWSCALTYFCAGVCVSSTFVSHNNILYETCPHDHRLSHITVGNMVLALPLMLGGLLGGQVAESLGLLPLFGMCLVLSLGGAAWLALLVRDPRNEDFRVSPLVSD
jgi:predicted MFS family arabinose efflux permease